MQKNPIIILGKSFKPETNIVTGSPSIYLYNSLKKKRKNVFIWDPEVDSIELDHFIKINKINKKKYAILLELNTKLS